jgi:hypothetical protein
MADDASRLWHLADAQLLTHLNLTYPQNASWRMCPPPTTMLSATIGALLQRQRVPMSLLNAVPLSTPHGVSGRPFVSALPPIPSSPQSMTGYLFSSCLPTATAPAPSRPAATRFALEQWRTPSRAVGQTFAGMGAPDPRLNLYGATDFRLVSLLRAWAKADAPGPHTPHPYRTDPARPRPWLGHPPRPPCRRCERL